MRDHITDVRIEDGNESRIKFPRVEPRPVTKERAAASVVVLGAVADGGDGRVEIHGVDVA